MFSSQLMAPLFLSCLAAFVATVGLILVAVRSDWSRRYAPIFALVASGLLLTMVITHLAPEALNADPLAPMVMLAGFFLGLFLHDTLKTLLPVPNAGSLAAGLTPMIAIGIHSFVDGMIYTVAFAKGQNTGLFATLGLVLHEMPEGIITFALLRAAGVSNRNSFILAFFAAALTTPLGTLVAFPFVHSVEENVLTLLFSLSAGLLLFVSTGPLMAHMHEEKPIRSIPALMFGVCLALLIAAFSHSHGAEVHDHDHSSHDHPSFLGR